MLPDVAPYCIKIRRLRRRKPFYYLFPAQTEAEELLYEMRLGNSSVSLIEFRADEMRISYFQFSFRRLCTRTLLIVSEENLASVSCKLVATRREESCTPSYYQRSRNL